MPGSTSCLVFAPRSAFRKRLISSLRSLGAEAFAEDDGLVARKLIDAGVPSVVLLDITTPAAITAVLPAINGQLPTIAMSPEGSGWNLADVLCDLELEHFVPLDGEPDLTSAAIVRSIATAVRSAGRHGPQTIVDLLADVGSGVCRFQVKRAEDRERLLECAGDYLEWIGAHRLLRSQFLLTLDELVTNAVYNAPRDEAGRPRYASFDRREKVALQPTEYVDVSFASDGERIAISVVDRFGALALDRLRQRIRDCFRGGEQIEDKAGGAGIGLFSCISAAESLVFNVARGRRSEVIAAFPLARRRQRSMPSVYFFLEDRPMHQEQPSIVLSAELKEDILTTLAKDGYGRVVLLTSDMKKAQQTSLIRSRRAPCVARGTNTHAFPRAQLCAPAPREQAHGHRENPSAESFDLSEEGFLSSGHEAQRAVTNQLDLDSFDGKLVGAHGIGSQ